MLGCDSTGTGFHCTEGTKEFFMSCVAISAIIRCVSGASFAEGAAAAEELRVDREPKLFCFTFSTTQNVIKTMTANNDVEMVWKSASRLLI